MAITTSKEGIRDLAARCYAHGIREVVFSPGSRNAPLVLAFNALPGIKTHVVPDERAAGFVALGLALASGRPVALSCTSGSALLNYAPAIAEAFYLRIPLVVLSADRPMAWVDQADGQTIRQNQALQPHLLAEYQLHESYEAPDSAWQNARSIDEGLLLATSSVGGPVHFNLPLTEPLYTTVDVSVNVEVRLRATGTPNLPEKHMQHLAQLWQSCGKKLLLVGQQPTPNVKLNQVLERWKDREELVVLSETTSNLPNGLSIGTIDVLIHTPQDDVLEALAPELLLVAGGAVVSKKVKSWLRKHKPKHIWVFDASPTPADTYQGVTVHIQSPLEQVLDELLKVAPAEQNTYYQQVMELWRKRLSKGVDFVANAPFSDLWVFDVLLKRLPANSTLHCGNSSAVRYLQLFDLQKNLYHHSNRGTSGIDGSTGTAVGYALGSEKLTTLVLGDVSFLYDHNGLWVESLPSNLRIVVINNGGGGIFRIIPGPASTPHLERFFETRLQVSIEHLARAYGLKYYRASNEHETEVGLQALFSGSAAGLLEIFTPREQNNTVLDDFFKSLNHG